jgi:hypothetical protein
VTPQRSEVGELWDDYIYGRIDHGVRRVALLLSSENQLPKEWAKQEPAFAWFTELSSLHEELKEIPLRQYDYEWQRRKGDLEKRILFAFKSWG